MRLKALTVIVAGLLLAAGAAPARADLSPTLFDVIATPDGNLWVYQVDVSGAQNMSATGSVPTAGINPEDDETGGTIKDYLTIYDFAGFLGVVQFSDSGFDYRVYSFGSTPADSLPEEDGDPNITIFRTAGDLIGPTGFFVAILSSVPESAAAFNSYAGEGTNKQLGTGETNVGEIVGPGTGAPSQVPEPGTLLLVGAGLLGIGMYRRKTT